MMAIVKGRYGAPERVLHLEEIARAPVGDDDVLVRVRATSVNTPTWAVYSAGLGYLGGVAFEREPLKGVALGLGLALAITAAHEALRLYRGRGEGAR